MRIFFLCTLLVTCAFTMAPLSALAETECPKGPTKHCCISTVQVGSTQPDGKVLGEVRKEQCEDGTTYFYGDCYCRVGDAITPPKFGYTYQFCSEECQGQKGEIAPQGIGLFKPPAAQVASDTAAAGSVKASSAGKATQQFINALCFTLDECSDSAYGGSSDAWVKSSECPANKGKCLAPEPEVKLSSPILGVTTVKGLRMFVDLMFKYFLAIIVITAAVAFVYGGFRYIVGSSMGDISRAKEYITNSVIGLILGFTAVAILNTINPATTKYDKLDIFLINKEQFSQLEFCKDYKPDAGKILKFADAGDPAGSAAYDSAEFNKEMNQVMCGKEYYPQGFGGQTCKGSTCTNKGEACIKCQKGIAACSDEKKSYTCVKATFAGNMSKADDRVVTAVYLLGVCNFVQPPVSGSQVSENIKETIKVDLMSGEKGLSYLYAGKPDILEKMKSSCASSGGLRGVVVGVAYGGPPPEGIKGTLSKIVNGTQDYGVFIVTKQDCGSGRGGYYSGYAQITSVGVDIDMKTAVYCGYRVKPNSKSAGSQTDTFSNNSNVSLSPYWTPEELEKAFKGDAPITCDISLSKVNAPKDPTAVMDGCKFDWQPPKT